MNYTVHSFMLHEVVGILAKAMKAKVKVYDAESVLNLPAPVGEGYIKGIDFKDGIGMLIFNCTFKKDVSFRYISEKFQPLRFVYCLEGNFYHHIGPDNFEHTYTPLQGSIVAGTCNSEQVFEFPAGMKIVFNTLDIDRAMYFDKIEKHLNTLHPTLADVFADIACEYHFAYHAPYSLAIAETIQQVNNSRQEGMVRKIFLEAKALKLLFLQLEQYEEDARNDKKRVTLRKDDLYKVIEARNILLHDLKEPPTIKKLAKQVGLNETKLKKGFKEVHNSTIYNFVLDERLKQARYLFTDDGYSVKEVAALVGYANPSHFTARFKEKYGILPKDYKRQHSTTIDKRENQ